LGVRVPSEHVTIRVPVQDPCPADRETMLAAPVIRRVTRTDSAARALRFATFSV
jgi:hypothetical protein